jgi:excisionase family DNA binding protein
MSHQAQLSDIYAADAGPPVPLLLTVEQLAALLEISVRSVWRLVSARRMPLPIRLGKSVRWRRLEIETWITAGCPTNEDCKLRTRIEK